MDLESRIGQLRVRHELSPNWRLSVGALDQIVERDISTQVNALTDNAGNYTASLASGFAPRFRVFSNLSHLNGRVMTGRISHEVAIGVTGYTFKTYSDVTNPPAANVRLGTANIAAPVGVRSSSGRNSHAYEPVSLQRDSSTGREYRRQRRAWEGMVGSRRTQPGLDLDGQLQQQPRENRGVRGRWRQSTDQRHVQAATANDGVCDVG